MIALPPRALPAATALSLAKHQAMVDNTTGTYADRVAKAKSLFSEKNTPSDPLFRIIRAELTAMCSGAMRCVYCEDSARDQVEHFRPKTLYPESAFEWENYAYTCGRCNRIKLDKFAVFRNSDGAFEDVTRARHASIVPPTPGRPVFLFGRVDDPLEFLELDLVDTFYFVPRAGLSAENARRAEYTREELKLNSRDELPIARRQAYEDFRARVSEYCLHRDADVAPRELVVLRDNLRRCNHPTVWLEMKRQRTSIAELRQLFANAPEALEW